MSEPEHIFWAKRWAASRRLCKGVRVRHYQIPDIAMLNYMTYLTEVFSWYKDHYKIFTIRRP